MAYISHLDFLRLVQRIARRAGLPCSYSEGFNPHMKLSFPYALPLFMEAENEGFSLLLEEKIDTKSMILKLNENSPDGLCFLKAIASDSKYRSPEKHSYIISVPENELDLWKALEQESNTEVIPLMKKIKNLSIDTQVKLETDAPLNPIKLAKQIGLVTRNELEITGIRKL